jgi:hypothetical protein
MKRNRNRFRLKENHLKKLCKYFFQILPKKEKIICARTIIEASSLKMFDGVATNSVQAKG